MIAYLKDIWKNRHIFVAISILILLYFGSSFFLSFNTDTYYTVSNGFYKTAIDMFRRNGRPIISLFYFGAFYFGISGEEFYYLSSVFAFLFLGMAIYIYQDMLSFYISNYKYRILISFVSIANPFIIEYFMFMEKCAFMLAILFVVIGVWKYVDFMRINADFNLIHEKRHSINNIFIMLIMEILAMSTYQGVVGLFVILCLPFIYHYSKNLKDYLTYTAFILLCYAITIILEILVMHCFTASNRIISNFDLFKNLVDTFSGIRYIFIETFKILPKRLFAFVVICTFVKLLLNSIHYKLRVFYLVLLVLLSLIIPMASNIYGAGWIAMRIVYPIGSLYGCLLTDYSINDGKRNIKPILLLLCTIILIEQYISFNKIFIDKYQLNYSDMLRAQYVGQAIKEYEEQTNQVVKHIVFYRDKETMSPFYPRLYNVGDLIYSSFYTEWSDINAINYYLGTKYDKGESDLEYSTYFYNKDWDYLSNSQLLFEGDTLHLCVY